MEEIRTETPIQTPESHFDGTTLQLIGWRLLGWLLSAVTLGIGAAWAYCMVLRWEIKHTVVEGKRLRFDGKGHQLLGHWLLWGLLTVLTLGIYAIFIPVRMEKWRASHIRFAAPGEYREEPVSGAAILAGVLAGILGLVLIAGGVFLVSANWDSLKEAVLPTESTEPQPEFENFEGMMGIINGQGNIIYIPMESLPVQEEPEIPEATYAEGVYLPSPNDDEDFWYVNNPKEGLNLRYGPDTSYDVIRNLPHGTEIEVLEWENGWAFTGEGWVAGNYLEINPPKDAASKEESKEEAKEISSGLKGEKPQDKSIVGTWLFVSDHSDSHFENLIFEFRSDGVFVARCRPMTRDSDGTYYHSNGDIPGWDVICRPTWSGTYTYDGATLELHYLRQYTYSTDGPTSDPNTKIVGFWGGVDKFVTLSVTAQGDNMYIGNPQDIRYYPFNVPLSFGSHAEHYFWPLPDGADTAYDYRKEIAQIFG